MQGTTQTRLRPFLSSSRGSTPPPFFHFWGTPGCRTKCPFCTVGHRQNIKIFHLRCHQVPFDATSDVKLFWKSWLWLLGECEGSRLVGGTRLVVFPRFLAPYRPKNTTSRDPYPPSSRDPPSGRDPSPPSAPLWEGARVRGPGTRGGPGSWLSRTVGGLAVVIPRAGSPNEPGPLASPELCLGRP